MIVTTHAALITAPFPGDMPRPWDRGRVVFPCGIEIPYRVRPSANPTTALTAYTGSGLRQHAAPEYGYRGALVFTF
ncbi:hypothetical protein GCM10009799_19660 [Nocardiopsis rhodophaea]|uniref:Uncharacterized protein n=1 Tax=Nocardiopsis rhodophaea TaxID=280238 RepID=A0ABP5E9J0_9ACTN